MSHADAGAGATAAGGAGGAQQPGGWRGCAAPECAESGDHDGHEAEQHQKNNQRKS